MKLFTQWKFILLSALFSLLGVGSAWAQLTELVEGKVYHFVNAKYTDKAMGATNPQSVAGVAANEDSKAQLWYVERKGDNGYALRNLGYGTYLQANGQSSNWTLASTTDADNSWITLEKVGNYTAFKGYTYTYGGYGYAHIDGGSNIVGWESGADATQWTITQKDMLDEDIQEALNFFNSIPTIQKNLDDLFSDKSCTTLKGAFNENDASFKALPATLQAMVRKVAGKASWEETNFTPSKAKWDAEYAKKYRVQLYEPYNEPECAAKALGLNAHTNLNNPTGIFANNGDIVYVMVESEIKAGSSLYLTYHIGHGELGGYANGWELHQGLNVIPVYNNETNFCINYVVHTFDTSDGKKGNKAKARKLSDYDPIKIHIEGGHINGYWNKVGDELYAADNNDTWNYLEARATQKTVTVLGKYITLQFPLLDEHTVDTDGKTNKGLATYFNDLVKIEDCINEWDNVMLWERLLLGVLGEQTILKEAKKSPYSDKATVFEYTGKDGEFESDYSDYYNIHGLSYGIPNSYMYGGWAHCGYNFNTMEGIIQNLPTNAGSHWGPGHEIGHQHQELLTVNGLTEVTNNLFSNVVLWYYGETTSRYNGSEGALSNVLAQFNAEGTDFFSNNIWAQTIMYYKLFLYYHVLGHNPKFYPRLFEMLRQDPMSKGYTQDGSKCLMHFYKKCCLAAGEDLTEFFRAHGFFEVMENRYVGDYSPSVYNLTQKQIDDAIAEVKSWKYPENLAVLFVNDATGETIKSYKGDNLDLYGETTVCAEVGSYASFATATTPSYNYAISGNTVTMEGSGGVGFAILNEKGELIGFSDKKIFEISAEAAAAIASGKASVVTLNADNTSVAATNVMDTGNTEAKYELLGELLGSARQLLDLSDETGTKVGYYRDSYLTNLEEAYESAKEVYDAQTIAAYSAMYDVLYQEYANLLNNDYARVNITEGYAYRLVNKAYPSRSMSVQTSGSSINQMCGLETVANNDAKLWYFEAGASPGTYYLKNKATGLYPGDVSTGAVLKADKSDKTTDNGAHAYRLQNMGNGVFALVGETGLHCSASQSYNIVGWGADANATQWYITATALDETLEARTKLEELVGKTEALINEVGTVEEQGVEPITLTADAYYCNARCINTQWDKFSSYSVLNDGNIDTYLHTDYSGDDSEDGYAHYIRMDVGESSKVQMFKINYTTRNYLYPTAPTSITVEGSNDLTTWEPIETNFTEGLPTDKGTAFTTPAFGNGIKYRYIRLVVNSNDSNQEAGPEGNKHKYFALSELGISKVNYTTALNATYNTINSKLLSDLYSGMLEANGTLATSSQADVLNAAYTTLYTTYKALLDAKTGVEKTALTAKKEQLQTLINKTKALIGECGSVVNNEETTPQLSITGAPYLLTDNNGASRGSLDKLYDGLQGEANSYTSNWESTPTKPSYLQVDLGTGKEEEKLIFTFTNRNEGDAPTPTEIVVSASADGNDFIELATFTSAEPNWPPAANKQNIAATKWTSPEIKATSACRYWRFTVTKSQRNSGGETNANGIYHFGISEFGIVIPAGCKVTVNEGMGGVTKELLLATYDENQEAQSTHDYATTEAQVEKAIADLQAQYDALETAYNVLAPELQEAVDAAQEFLNDTPQTVGYPTATQRATFQAVIDRHESVEAINNAKTAFVETTDINLPEDGKAYKISAWWRTKQWPLTFIAEGQGSYACKKPAYAPVENAEAAVFVCRDLGNGEYAFVTNNGYYLGWQSDTKANKTAMDFTVGGVKNAFKVSKSVANANGDNLLGVAELFGTVNLCGHHDNNNSWWHYMFSSSTTKFHDAGAGATYYGDNAHTIYYKFEEVTAYTLNTIKMNALGDDDHQLLTGLETGMSMSTFSAPYPTVTPEGITAYYAEQFPEGDNTVVTLKKMRTAIPANQGVVLVGEVGVSGTFKMLPAAGEVVPAAVELNNRLSATGAQSVVMSQSGVDYILGKGSKGAGFYKAKAGSTLAAGKAYFHFENAAQVRNFVLRFGGETTDIEDAVLAPATDNDAIYDLSGRRVNEVTKGGIYIKNGKKFIVK